MGLSDARAALNNAVNEGQIPSGPPTTGGADTPNGDQAPDLSTSQDSAPSSHEPQGEAQATNQTDVQGTTKEQRQNAISEALYDLDKSSAQKIMFQGKEWTKEELKNAYLRQEDYSRKTLALTEQRRSVEQEQKFADNFAADVQHVLNDPALVAKFKELYPPRYHASLDRILQNLGQTQVQTQANGQQGQNPQGQSGLDPATLKRLQAIETEVNFSKQQREEMERNAHTQNVAAAEAEIASTFDKLSKKYPMADEVNCINAGQIYLENNPSEKRVPEKVWENIFKSVNDMHTEKYKSHYREQVKQQKLVNSKGKDTPAGGGTPGSAPVKMRLKDVGEYAAKVLSGRS